MLGFNAISNAPNLSFDTNIISTVEQFTPYITYLLSNSLHTLSIFQVTMYSDTY